MKSSPLDTFCRALVLGAALGALGWGAVRYTNLPQLALQQITSWSAAAQGKNTTTTYPNPPQETLVATPPTDFSVTLPSVAREPSDNQPTKNSLTFNTPSHPTQQAAYLEAVTPAQGTLQHHATPREAIEQRLCDLGAVYSLLEMWGHESIRYRYHCRVALTNNHQVTRSFEANGTSPEDAMRQVLKAVERFQSTSSLQGPQVR